jgi:hypothetical protein
MTECYITKITSYECTGKTVDILAVNISMKMISPNIIILGHGLRVQVGDKPFL